MNVLVLGGTQFVSRALAIRLIACEHEVTILTRGIAPVDYEGAIRHVRADRTDAASLRQMRGMRFDAVFDVSGYSVRDIAPVLESLALDERTKYVFLSSGAVYRTSDEPMAEDAPKGENEIWGAYGSGKLAAEELLCAQQSRRGFPLAIIRPAYIYGPGNNLYREAYLFDRLERGAAIPIPKGAARTQFVHIDDLVRMLEGLPRLDWRGAEALNYTHPVTIGWEHLVASAAAAVGVEPRSAAVDYRGKLDAREFFPFRDCTYLLDTAKAERFGLALPEVGLAKGLEEAYAWYRRARPTLHDAKMTEVEAALSL
ncbi:NAD-dependent epimerase/dehydratase family protein [Raoultibacter phocaeensis]|uniref:NAD-dependent epimerase/dehydratase family protein n=1 Tax=Raoultibacter phocaeensis TaxID=2479841 RepID=UPI00111AA6A4|nr:NAD-dependent epimerase/dehydratase family protein [Raoultibacter phocaeensis]